LCPALSLAQNGVTVSGLDVKPGTVTFNVSWKNTGVPDVWSDTVWVFVDYNNGTGKMVRLPLSPGATLTATSAPGAGKVMEVPGNDQGVWVVGNARSAGSFSATVQLLTATTGLYAMCAYTSNYPPVGKYLSAEKLSFTGTPEYQLLLKHIESGATSTASSRGEFTLPADYVLASFNDATGSPGRIQCIPPAVQTLNASASGFCVGSTSVSLALAGTENGAGYQLYRNGSPVGAVLAGTGSPATFTEKYNVTGTYTARVAAGMYCPAIMTGTHTVTSYPSPAIALSGGVASQTVDRYKPIATITYTASNATGIALSSGRLPAGVTGAAAGTRFTISGTPSDIGTFNYAVTASHTNGCASNPATGAITVRPDTPPGAVSAQSWYYGAQRWSDNIVASPAGCTKTNFLTLSMYQPQYIVFSGRYYYNWACVDAAKNTLCPSPWRVPSQEDIQTLINNTNAGTLSRDWGYGGYVVRDNQGGLSDYGFYWSSSTSQFDTIGDHAWSLVFNNSSLLILFDEYQINGLQVKCVK
jgi:hypothetical protein